jgi:hypothetical protein
MLKSDVTVSGGRTILLFHLETSQAREWVEEHVSDQCEMLGPTLAVEPRFGQGLLHSMLDGGLIVGFEDDHHRWPEPPDDPSESPESPMSAYDIAGWRVM